VLEGSVGGQDSVVWLDNGVTELGGGVNAELELGLLSVISRKTLKQESTKTGASSTAERVEDEEALETRTIVGQAPDHVHNYVDLFFSYSVVTTSVIASSVLLSGDEGLRVEKTAVSASSDLVDDIGLKVNVEGTGNVFPGRGFREEGAEPVATGRGSAFDQTAVRTEAVLNGIQFPASVSNLNTSLANVERDDFPHTSRETKRRKIVS